MYLYQYDDSNFRLVLDKTLSCVNTHIKKEKDTEANQNSIISSLSRARKVLREYSMCNDFVYFFTATVSSSVCNRYSLDVCQDKIRYIIHDFIKKKNKNFKYFFITEKHKDGAFHFHGLCNDLDLYTNSNGFLSSSAFDKLGFNSFSKIKSKEKVSNYILKYITKDCVRNSKGSIYFCSRGLKRAIRHNLQNVPIDILTDYFFVKPYENQYKYVFDFNLDKISNTELLFLIDNLKEV